jgi:hypothetical protein
MFRQATAVAAVRPVVVVVKPIYGQAGTGFQVTHIKREKSPSTRTGHRCSHFAVHCNVVGSKDDRFSYLMRRTRGIHINRC